jgi:hypothetical protein
MTEEDVAQVNTAGALEFVVESATPNRLVVSGFVDDPCTPRVRIAFDEPLYIQMPWRFCAQTVERRSIRQLLQTAPAYPRWELPTRHPVPTELPSLSFEELHDASQEGASLLMFVSTGATPADPPCFVLARKITVLARGSS